MEDLQEVKRGMGNEGSTDPARGNITGSGLGMPSGSLGPDSDTGHVD
jgi:hypothetical protein